MIGWIKCLFGRHDLRYSSYGRFVQCVRKDCGYLDG